MIRRIAAGLRGHPARHALALAAVLIVAAAARTYSLAEIPAGFFCDEASIGFNAYSLLTTGRDEYGEPFPTFFRSFGDYRHPIPVYTTIPFVALFGLTELAVRLHAVFYGLATVLLLYLLGKAIRSVEVGVWAALAGAVMPWLIHYNRTGFEFSAYAAFFLGSIYLFIKSGADKRYIVPAFVVLGLTFYTYQPAKLLVPLLLCGAVVIYRRQLRSFPTLTAIGMAAFIILTIPLLLSFFRGEATARFNEVSILTLELPLHLTIAQAVGQYLLQLSPALLFWQGEPTPIERHFVDGFPPLLLGMAPFIIVGLILLVRDMRSQWSKVLLVWLLLYPVAGAVVSSAPFTSRSVIGAPLFALLVGLGVHATWGGLRRWMAIGWGVTATPGLLALLFVVNLAWFASFYSTTYPASSAGFWGWQYGPREIVSKFLAHEARYDDLVLAPAFNAPEIFFRFYADGECAKCLVGWPEHAYQPARRQLFALPAGYAESRPGMSFRIIDTVLYPHGELAFVLAEISP